MKHTVRRMIVILLLLAFVPTTPGFALTLSSTSFTVTVQNATVNGQTQLTLSEPTTLTALAALPDGAAPDHWEINGERVASGDYPVALVFEASGDTVVTAVPAQSAAPSAQTRSAPLVMDELAISAVNASIQLLDANGRPAGQTFERFTFGDDYAHPVTGETCAGGETSARISAPKDRKSQIDHWVLNGVPYYFSSKVWFITVYDLPYSLSFEVVYKKKTDWTERAAVLTDEQIVSAVDAQIQFVNEKRQPLGKKFTRFDFTNDYTSYATKANVRGGEFSGRIEAIIPAGMEVDHWLINGVPFYFNIAPRCITVICLNESTTYQPVFRAKKTKPTAPAETFSPEYNFLVEPESDRPNGDDPNTGYVIVDGLDGPINNYKP